MLVRKAGLAEPRKQRALKRTLPFILVVPRRVAFVGCDDMGDGGNPIHGFIAHVPDETKFAARLEYPVYLHKSGVGCEPMERLGAKDCVAGRIRQMHRLRRAGDRLHFRERLREFRPGAGLEYRFGLPGQIRCAPSYARRTWSPGRASRIRAGWRGNRCSMFRRSCNHTQAKKPSPAFTGEGFVSSNQEPGSDLLSHRQSRH